MRNSSSEYFFIRRGEIMISRSLLEIAGPGNNLISHIIIIATPAGFTSLLIKKCEDMKTTIKSIRHQMAFYYLTGVTTFNEQ